MDANDYSVRGFPLCLRSPTVAYRLHQPALNACR